jgi:hypothetical protein
MNYLGPGIDAKSMHGGVRMTVVNRSPKAIYMLSNRIEGF